MFYLLCAALKVMSSIFLNIFSANKVTILCSVDLFYSLLNCTTDTIQATAGRVLAHPGIQNPLKHSGYFMCHQVWQEELCTLRTVFFCVL